jgi:hypothetical protein
MLKDREQGDNNPQNQPEVDKAVLPAVSDEGIDPTRQPIKFGNFVPAFDDSTSKAPESERAEQATLPRVVLYLVTLFPLGQVVATPGAVDALETEGIQPDVLLGRHEMGDWGDLEKDDRKVNDDAVKTGGRIFSIYTLPTTQAKVWVITESDRSATTLLLPSEY